MNATRAAVEQGIVPGGGTALLWASRQLSALKDKVENFDQKMGIEIIERACRAPAKVNTGIYRVSSMCFYRSEMSK